MTGAELGVLGAILLAVVGLLIKAFIPAKKNNPSNPVNEDFLIDLSNDVTAIKAGIQEIIRALGRIEGRKP